MSSRDTKLAKLDTDIRKKEEELDELRKVAWEMRNKVLQKECASQALIEKE